MSDFWGVYSPALKVVVFGLAIAVLFSGARVTWSLNNVNVQPNNRDASAWCGAGHQACFWLAGAVLSVFPVASAEPMDCNLLFVGVGAMAALGLVLANALDKPPALRWQRFVIGALAISNLAIAPVLLPAKCLTMLGMGFGLSRTDASIPRDPSVSDKTLVVVWAISEGGLYASWNHRYADAIPGPAKMRLLATSLGDVSVTRLDEVTLRLRADHGFYDAKFQQLMRSLAQPFRRGDVVKLSNMTATVTETTVEGRPKNVDFRFMTALESNEWLWMRGEGLRLVSWIPPRLGETVWVKAGFW
jgi:hypothetical protein